MSKFNLDCKVAATNAMQAARTELRLFCHIMGIADNIYNHFIGDDQYGVVDFQDGLYDFSMTDIHVVVSEYEHWLELYGSNEALARAVRQWYYWSLDWHQKHPAMTWTKPEHEPYDGQKTIVAYERSNGEIDYQSDVFFDEVGWEGFEREDVRYWLELTKPDDTYCPNLRAWLSGCPVPGLREATERYKSEQANSLEECRKRTKEAQEAFDKCIAETKGE